MMKILMMMLMMMFILVTFFKLLDALKENQEKRANKYYQDSDDICPPCFGDCYEKGDDAEHIEACASECHCI